MSYPCTNEVPDIRGWRKHFTYFMTGAAVLGQAFLGFQTYKTYSSKNTEGLSIYGYIALCIGYAFWIFYAAYVTLRVDMPVLLGSIIGLGLGITIIIGIAMYGHDIWDF